MLSPGLPFIFFSLSIIKLGFSCCSSNSNCPLQDYTENDLTLYYTEQTKGDTKNRQICKHFSRQVITVARRVYLLEVLQIFSDLKVAAIIVQTYNVLPNYTLLA